MIKRYTIATFLLCMTSLLWAQYPGAGGFGGGASSIKGKITGSIVDSTTNVALEYVSVSLFKSGRSKPSNGAISESDGAFKLRDVAPGVYTLRISSIGFAPKTLRQVKTTEAKPDLDLGQIQMVPIDVQMDEVEITAEKALIENRIDKIVYNAEQDVMAGSGDATDLLRKVPLLSLDLEGNISIRGSRNIQILVNGKPSGMFASNPADALKMIPSEQIKSVEVITSPSAKYDGEGSGGIVNIITKKKRVEGFSGTVAGQVGTVQNNGSLSLNVAKGRFGINGNGFIRRTLPQEGRSNFFREDYIDGQTRVLDQQGTTFSGRTGFGGRFGAYYDINGYNSLTSNFNIRGQAFDREGSIDAVFTDPILTLNQAYNQAQETNTLSSGYDWNTDYTRTFEKKEKEFSMSAQVSGNITETDFDLDRTSMDPTLLLRERGMNTGDNLEVTFQADYTHPFSKNVKLEIGAKTILREIVSDYTYDLFQESVADFVRDLDRSNSFLYNQDVYAGYASLNLKLGKKYGLIAGARYENTSISGSFNRADTDALAPFSNQYDNLLPSVILNRKLKGFASVKLAYNQRIQRPSLQFINPFTNSSDQRNITVGNPELDPEIANQIELSYTNVIKRVVLNMGVFYRRTDDIIENIVLVDPEGVTTTTYSNVGSNNSFGVNLFTSFSVKKFWSLRGGFNLFTYDASGTIDGSAFSNQGFQYNANLGSSLNMKYGIKAEVFGFFNSPRPSLQGIQASFSYYQAGIKKEILKKRGNIGMTFITPFNKFLNFESEFTGDNFYQFTLYQFPLRSIGFNFDYKFGKLNFKARQTKIKNDDQKQGQDSGF
ncbi:MAG: outer membrane beta-barrel family protein [Bacteroidota bacterium]